MRRDETREGGREEERRTRGYVALRCVVSEADGCASK